PEPLVRVRVDALAARARRQVDGHAAAEWEGAARADRVETLRVVVPVQREAPAHDPHLTGRTALARAGSRSVLSVDPDVPRRGVEDVEAARAEPRHAHPVAVRAAPEDVDDALAVHRVGTRNDPHLQLLVEVVDRLGELPRGWIAAV